MTASDSHTSQNALLMMCVCFRSSITGHTHSHTHKQTPHFKKKHAFSTRTQVQQHTNAHVVTHMFLVSNVSSAVAGDKSITGREVHRGKRLSGSFFSSPHTIDPILLASSPTCLTNPGMVMD